jgi:predicted lipoprotein with Yx(FWY)xxD motif
MKPTQSMLAAVAALLLLAGPALADPAGPSVATREGIGPVLVDGAGKTLYVFKKDSPGQSTCQGECVAKWPVYFVGDARPIGLRAEDFGAITRADGQKQTTYKGMPLYFFAGDKGAGDAKGHGLKDVWHAAVP